MALSSCLFHKLRAVFTYDFSCLQISHDLSKAQGQRVWSLVAPDLLMLLFLSVWAPSSGVSGQHHLGISGTGEQLLWVVSASGGSPPTLP